MNILSGISKWFQEHGASNIKVALFSSRYSVSTNPGSPDAMRLGCLCSPLANHYGEGAVEDGKIVDKFLVNDECPIHADARRVKNPEPDEINTDRPETD